MTSDPGDPPTTPHVSAAQAHEAAGRPDDARACYEQALSEAPGHIEANYRLGILFAREGRYAEALPHFKAALEAAPTRGRHWLALTDTLLRADRPADALKLIDQGIAKGLTVPEAKALRERARQALAASGAAAGGTGPADLSTAQALFKAGRYADAVQCALGLVRARPKTVAAWKILGASLHAQGRRDDAVRAFRKATEANPTDAELVFNLGAVLTEQGQLQDALAAYRTALSLNPGLLPAHLNLAGVLAQAGQADDAAFAYRQALAIDGTCAEAHLGLGQVLAEQGRLDEGAAAFRQALAYRSDFAEAHSNLGTVLRQQGQTSDSEAAYRAALALAPESPAILTNLAALLEDQDRLDEAEAALRQALTRAPRSGDAAFNLGNVLFKADRLAEAEQAFRNAERLQPDTFDTLLNLGTVLYETGKWTEAEATLRRAAALHPTSEKPHANLGLVLEALGRADEAEEAYRAALARAPDAIDVHASLLGLLEFSNRTEALRAQLAEARQACGEHPKLALASAHLLRRDGDLPAARACLEAVDETALGASLAAARSATLGDLCDRLGDTGTAVRYFERNNALAATRGRRRGIDKQRFTARIEALSARFAPAWIESWTEATGVDDRPAPVFLVGFPRSGTTLLDTVLRSHPGITVVEEQPTVLRLRRALAGLSGGDPDGLASLGGADFTKLRTAYFTELDRHLDGAAASPPPLVIDKLPLNLVEAGLIHRVFPNARFLFALRHPCDSVLSCWMHDFRLNDQMAHFLELEDAAALYDRVMALWQHYCAALPLSVQIVRYESLLERFETEVRAVLDFLGLPWDPAVLDYAETARKRGRIATPSYDQVTQPLYTRAAGRWTRYRACLEPVLPILTPWIDRFGYGKAA